MSAPTVPARGEQESLVTLDAAAMVHLSATSGSGTRCTVVDQVRGPFATSGTVGKASCELDLLLDQGTYKVRLSSPARGKGQVKVSAAAFTEQNPRPVRLSPRQRITGTLKPGQQASYWISVSNREVPYLRVSGRTAGEVKLWRNGEWVEEVPLRRTTVWPSKSKAVHEWWLDRPLDAGDYLVTVYGTNAMRWAGGGETDALEVERAFLAGAVDRQFPFTVPESGVVAVEAPRGNIAALLSLKTSPKVATVLQAFDFGSGNTVESPSSQCRLEPKALVPECAAQAGGDVPHLLLVRGEPGTQGVVEWAPWGMSGTWRGGYYGAATQQMPLRVSSSGTYLVGVHDLPADTDAAPLGCQLEEEPTSGPPVVLARDVMRIDDGQMFDREFNYDGSSAFIWFQVTKGDRYRLQTKGERKSRCEVFRVAGDSAELKRLTQSKPDAKSCNEALVLTPGVYQLSLYEGLPGVEHLVIREDNQRTLKPIAAKASCLIPEVPLAYLGNYRLVTNRVGAVTARGIVVNPLPLSIGAPLHVLLDAGAKLSLPVANGTFQVRGAGLWCGGREAAAGKDGECVAQVDSGTLKLSNPTSGPVATTVFRPGQAPPVPKFEAWAPPPRPLQRVPLDVPTFFDFGREESHSMVFDVDKAGLYHVTTQGLLSTLCRLRTPVVPSVAVDTSGGRARNCLVAGYLRPGRYLLTVGTVGSSRGRGAVLMTRRNPRELSAVGTDGEAFFRVDSGELVQQKLVAKRWARYALSTTAQGVGVQCRLDDAQGWPVEPVPSNCVGTRALRAGSYLWTQLPLTVDSMRRTRLEQEKPPVVLKGNKAHPVNFFTWYRAELFRDGKDEFLFELTGAVQLDVVLTDGMQGRIEVLEADKPPRAVEVIPPRAEPRREEEQASGEGEGGGESEGPPPESEYVSGDEGGSDDSVEGESGEGESADEEEAMRARNEARERARERARQRANERPLEAAQVPTGPQGVKVKLPPGKYRLVTQHSKGDVGVTYNLHLSADAMLPGMARTMPVPARVPVIVPTDGTLRLRTFGEADVRCRLLRPDGSLVFENSENGPDWNCAAAVPVVAGTYSLLVESETQTRGETTTALALAPTEDKPTAKDGTVYEVARGVLRIPVPAAEPDGVHELVFGAKTPFSCALEDPTGKVVFQRGRVTTCTMLVRPKTQAFKARLWTTDGSAKVTSTVRTRAVAAFERGTLAADKAARVQLKSAGRYQTAPQSFCIAESATGPMRPCGPDSSFAAGGHVIATSGTAAASLSLQPIAKKVALAATDSTEALSRTPQYEGLEASGASVFLLAATVGYGERAAPDCGFEGPDTVRELTDAACHAASAVGTSATTRLDAWVSDDAPVPSRVLRRAVPVPGKAGALSPGRQTLTWQADAGLFSLPSGQRTRIELTLPAGTWAVLLSPKGGATDLCAPSTDLRRCVLLAEGHQLFLTGAEARAEATVLKLEAPERRVRFSGLYEEAPSAAGTLTLDVAATATERLLTAEGATRCLVVLADGRRTAGCRATLPADKTARVELEHDGAPLRVVAHVPGDEKWARLGEKSAGQPAPKLEPAAVAAMSGARLERTLTLAKEAVVRLRSDSGVCGLLRGNDLLSVDGLGRGCDLVRLLPAGTYRAVVRGFGGQSLAGGLQWSADPVTQLADGVGNEEWIGPGEVRLFRFGTLAAGKVGLGVQVRAEQLDCTVYDDAHQPLGQGCQQYLSLNKGQFLLSVRQRARSGAAPMRFRPVVLGLSGTREEVPEAYLKDLFSRIGDAK